MYTQRRRCVRLPSNICITIIHVCIAIHVVKIPHYRSDFAHVVLLYLHNDQEAICILKVTISNIFKPSNFKYYSKTFMTAHTNNE